MLGLERLPLLIQLIAVGLELLTLGLERRALVLHFLRKLLGLLPTFGGFAGLLLHFGRVPLRLALPLLEVRQPALKVPQQVEHLGGGLGGVERGRRGFGLVRHLPILCWRCAAGRPGASLRLIGRNRGGPERQDCKIGPR